jgi:serine/threonine protein phosphatase PrpC
MFMQSTPPAGSRAHAAHAAGWPVDRATAEISLLGHREDNQDRVHVAVHVGSVLLMAVDGMGGHSEGAHAAETALAVMQRAFASAPKPLLDPQGFLHLALGRAHAEVVKLGRRMALETRPRATCAVAIAQDDGAWWAHIGDSRIYQLRHGKVLGRTRDHSHVELLLQQGLISAADALRHPLRNYVESCLGGDASVPEMSISRLCRLRPGDVLMLCTDGFWAGLTEDQIGELASGDAGTLQARLAGLAAQAVQTNAPHSDNTSAVALRW